MTVFNVQCSDMLHSDFTAMFLSQGDVWLSYITEFFCSRFDGLKGEMEAELNQEVFRVRRLHGALQQSQDLLATVERGVNNLYFRMSCVPIQVLSKLIV